MELFVVIERPDGTTYQQQVEWRENETIKKALARLKRMLGRKYYICDWWVM